MPTHLDQLLKELPELERFSRECEIGSEIGVAQSRRRWVMPSAIAGALAAAAAIAIVVWPSPQTTRQSEPRTVVRTVAGPTQSMAIAVYLDGQTADVMGDHGGCVQRWVPSSSVVASSDNGNCDALVRDSLDRACMDNPQRMVLFTLTGDRRLLPQTDDEAHVLAMCLLEAGVETNTPAGARCVEPGVSVDVESWNVNG